MIDYDGWVKRNSTGLDVKWPDNPDDWCGYFKALDRKYPDSKGTPLHHDNRCPLHK